MSARHLYVHVPFCARRCTYCDFSIAVRRHVPVAEYLDGLAREVALAGLAGSPETVYLGGGTPSKLGAAGIAAIAWLAHASGGVPEFSIEANPEDVRRDVVRAWVESGVNRLSIGAQSFDDRVLRWMHRTHDAAATRRAVAVARAVGVTNLSLDLIFAVPQALGRDWSSDLDHALALEPDHISLYGLTVEQGTPLGRQVARGEISAAPDSLWEDEYLEAHRRITSEGYAFYEISNAARAGFEARHNRAYWQLVPYLGIGPAAHSFDGSSRWWNEPAYVRWLKLLREGKSPVAGREELGDEQHRLERLYLALRTVEGVVIGDPGSGNGDRGELRASGNGDRGSEALLRLADTWVRAGWAVWRPVDDAISDPRSRIPDPGRLSLTPTGWLRLDELVASV